MQCGYYDSDIYDAVLAHHKRVGKIAPGGDGALSSKRNTVIPRSGSSHVKAVPVYCDALGHSRVVNGYHIEYVHLRHTQWHGWMETNESLLGEPGMEKCYMLAVCVLQSNEAPKGRMRPVPANQRGN